MGDGPAPSPATRRLRPGTRVEVRSLFEDRWRGGFEVAAVEDDGYRIRRSSDGDVLPEPLPVDQVRRERRRETWWV